MKKSLISLTLLSVLCASSLFAQSDDELFGSDDDFFFDDDDGIIEMEEVAAPKTDLARGVLFETGSVKIGGTFDLSLTTLTTFNKDKDFKDELKDTLLLPTAGALLTVDARPTDNLRMYMKTGIAYPFVTAGNSAITGTSLTFPGMLLGNPGGNITLPVLLSNDLSLRNMFYVKELFSDFNLGQNVAMRFGKQTVTWGVGYFYSPADVINLTQIDPENPTAQVEGPLCLRSQVVFPGTQSTLYGYIIPDTNMALSENGLGIMARDTALAAKGEYVIGGWEIGGGAWYKYQNPSRLTATASGTIFNKISVFGEAVFAFDQDTKFGQGTAGFMYNWKTPEITFMGQYYCNGDESAKDAFTGAYGQNAAIAINFGKILNKKLTANIFGIANFTNETTVASAMLNYNPVNELKLSVGPYLMWKDYNEQPVISAKTTFTLGGGKF